MRQAIGWFLAAVLAVGLTACGPGVARVYKGTTSATAISGGQSESSTINGAVVSVYPGYDGDWLFDVVSGAFTAKLAGTMLTFDPGQMISQTGSFGTDSRQLSTGTGTMTNEQLTLNITGTATRTGPGTNETGTFTVSFSGNRE
jgi:hypothetical protein